MHDIAEEIDHLAAAWIRSESESVLPRRPIGDMSGLRSRTQKQSEPPQPLSVLAARLDAEAAVRALVAQVSIAHGLRHDGPSNVPALLHRLGRWRGYLWPEAVLDLRHARRGLLRALDGSDTRPGIVPCPDLECEDAAVMLRAQRYCFGLECPACGRSWTGPGELEHLRRLVDA
ncbi:MAG: hypothetical protein V9E98_15095 [Candidatus Nanopelagicales bacterium]